MGILRDVIGGAISSATGAKDVNNGFNGRRLPFKNDRKTYSSSGGGRVSDLSDSLPPPYAAGRQHDSSTSIDDYRGRLDERHYYDDKHAANHKQRDLSTHSWDQPSSSRARRQPSPQNQGFWSSHGRSFRPLALPQTDYGDGSPFLRGYSDELGQYGITQDMFLQVIDAINVAIIPNPEVQIFQKGASIAGWFVPGAASIGLMAGQIGVGIGAAYGHASGVTRVLVKANLDVFVPRGLEICICHARDVDAEVSSTSSNYASDGGQRYGFGYGDGYGNTDYGFSLSPQHRLDLYGDSLAPLSCVLPPAMNAGRNDPIASIGRSLGDKQTQKKLRDAQKKMNKRGGGGGGGLGGGNTSETDKLEQGIKWLMVRRASGDAVARWRQQQQQQQQQQEGEQVQEQVQRQEQGTTTTAALGSDYNYNHYDHYNGYDGDYADGMKARARY